MLWALHFRFDVPDDRRTIKMLNVIESFNGKFRDQLLNGW